MLAGFDGTLTLVLVVAMMSLGVDWRLAAFALLPFPLMAWPSGGSRTTCTRPRATRWNASALNDHVQETLSGVRTVRALGLLARSEAQFPNWPRGAPSQPERAALGGGYEPAVGLTLASPPRSGWPPAAGWSGRTS
jgi:ATP-binding cassette subfamily B multidrug efflux pump